MEKNIIYVNKKPKKRIIGRDSSGCGVIKIKPEAAETLELFLEQAEGTNMTISGLASSLILFAAEHTIIKEV